MGRHIGIKSNYENSFFFSSCFNYLFDNKRYTYIKLTHKAKIQILIAHKNKQFLYAIAKEAGWSTNYI